MDINYSPLGFLISLFFIVTFLAPQVKSRAFFVFGDSLVDNGNNDYLVTTARADNYPYGIDYPTRRPTGRFSNGLNIPDIISEALGMPSTLPYLSPQLTGENLLVGANFASAGIGILNDTGIQFVNIIRISKQFEYFEQYQQRVSALIGPEATQQLVNQALVLITLGGNDFVNNYYLIPFSARSRQFALPDYVVYLISEYGKILRKLYELGARRVLVTGTGAMGCAPAELAQHSRNGECYGALQTAAALFNPRLVDLIASVNAEIGQEVFVAANAYQMNMDYLSNPEQFAWGRLIAWGLEVPSNCLFCGVNNETSAHIFFECDYAQNVWNGLLSRARLNHPYALHDIIRWLSSSQFTGKLRIILHLIFQAAIYHLWRERNSRLHTNASRSANMILKDITLQLRSKLFSLDREASSPTRQQQPSFLSIWFDRI